MKFRSKFKYQQQLMNSRCLQSVKNKIIKDTNMAPMSVMKENLSTPIKEISHTFISSLDDNTTLSMLLTCTLSPKPCSNSNTLTIPKTSNLNFYLQAFEFERLDRSRAYKRTRDPQPLSVLKSATST